MRFAHEPDNPAYPWSSAGGKYGPGAFVKPGSIFHALFAKVGADNVIWVWNPWHPGAVEDYFPGEEYIDWVGLTALNYADYNENKKVEEL
ncbi:MAG: glycosyl hydrolase [Owenweeksia sp.]|nr:glycosyl hydrolase [Owenweeksia sp.]